MAGAREEQSGTAAKRPFWMHHVVEYILGICLIAAGTQSPSPAVPATVGVVVLLYAASTKGAVAAFPLIPRRAHRVLDPMIVVGQLIVAVQPWLSIDVGTRAIIGGVAAVHFVVWLQSNYAERTPRGVRRAAAGVASTDDRATEIGRRMGRLVGQGITAARRRRDR